MEFSIYGYYANAQISDFRAFWILDVQIRDVQPVFPNNVL
jgi:hypothetical protein